MKWSKSCQLLRWNITHVINDGSDTISPKKLTQIRDVKLLKTLVIKETFKVVPNGKINLGILDSDLYIKLLFYLCDLWHFYSVAPICLFKNMQPKLFFLAYCNSHAPTNLICLLYTKPIGQLIAMHCIGGTATPMWLLCVEFRYDFALNSVVVTRHVVNSDRSFQIRYFYVWKQFTDMFKDLEQQLLLYNSLTRAKEILDDVVLEWKHVQQGLWRDLHPNVFVCNIATRWAKLLLLCSCKTSVVLKLCYVDRETNLNYLYFRGVYCRNLPHCRPV
jgi:hypothetical protein